MGQAPKPKKCKARTRKGNRCRNRARENGLCKIHQVSGAGDLEAEVREEVIRDLSRRTPKEPTEAEVQIEVARRIGRPTLLTEAIIDEVSMILRRGSYLETAAAWIGVTYRTLARWRARGLAEIQRVEELWNEGHEDVRIDEEELIYVRFCHATERAIADSDIRDLTNIEAAADGGLWTASAWRLERRHPGQWGRPWRPEEQSEDETESPVLSLVDEIRRKRQEGDRG